jgi:hypothetical protein
MSECVGIGGAMLRHVSKCAGLTRPEQEVACLLVKCDTPRIGSVPDGRLSWQYSCGKV